MSLYNSTTDSNAITPSLSSVDQAVAAFSEGRPVLVHDFDDREGETDLVYPAQAVSTTDVSRLRNDAGGLLCVALSNAVAEAFDLPFMQDALDHPAADVEHLEYDDRSSFSLTVNHSDTRTGVPDEERALTVRELASAAAEPGATDFARQFRAPGHVFLLRAAEGLLSTRRGHTELGVSLAKAAGCSPAVVVCEMLDDESGKALSCEDALTYAQTNGYPMVDGDQIVARLAP